MRNTRPLKHRNGHPMCRLGLSGNREGQLFLLTGVILTLTLLLLSTLAVSSLSVYEQSGSGDLLDRKNNVNQAFQEGLQLKISQLRENAQQITNADIRQALGEVEEEMAIILSQHGIHMSAKYLSSQQSKIDVYQVHYELLIQSKDTRLLTHEVCEIVV